MALFAVPTADADRRPQLHRPYWAGLTSARLMRGLGDDPVIAAQRLGLSERQLERKTSGFYRAQISCPAGEWSYWPRVGEAIWIGKGRGLAQVGDEECVVRFPVAEAMRRLDRAGMHCDEMRLLNHDGWSGPIDGRAGLYAIASTTYLGVSGYWTDDTGRTVRVELHEDGAVWLEGHAIVERWLLAAAG